MMTQEARPDFGERVATSIVRAHRDSATESEIARLTVLISWQLMLMGNLFAADAGLDVEPVWREELERASRWHERTLAMAARVPRA